MHENLAPGKEPILRGNISEQKTREEIVQAAHHFFNLVHSEKPFIAGETYIPVTAKVLDSSDLASLIQSSLDMWLTAGRFTREFERVLSSYFGRCSGTIFVNSGSSANLIAVSALGTRMLQKLGKKRLKSGDEVITLAAAFPTTVFPIIQNGFVPVFIDIDLTTLNAIPEAVMAARTTKTGAVILAHSLGNPFRSDILAEWCGREGIYLIEDCCDAFGSQVGCNLAPVGSFGDLSTLSFYPSHHITTGEGGALNVKESALERVAKSLRDWGRDCWCDTGKDNTCGKRFDWKLGDLPQGYDHKYTYSTLGYNLKATDMQAALGLSQLQKLPRFLEIRRANWLKLYRGIKESPLLCEKFIPVEPTPYSNPSWFGFPIHCNKGISREKVVSFLERHKVGSRLMFCGNITKQPAFSGVDYRVSGDLKNTDIVMNQTFWIGVHPGLSDQRIIYMLEQLESVARNL